jgi:hypothetical protein
MVLGQKTMFLIVRKNKSPAFRRTRVPAPLAQTVSRLLTTISPLPYSR